MSNTYTKYASIVDAANAHVDSLIANGLATEADKATTIESAIGNLAKIYSEQFGVDVSENYSHTAADQMASLLEIVGSKAATDNPLTALAFDVDISDLTDLLGKTIDDFHDDDVEIDGLNVTGTIKYVTGYTAFSGDPELQHGNYVVLHAAVPDVAGVTIKVKHTLESTLDADGIVIVHIVDKNIPVVFTATKEGYGKVVKSVSLAGLTLEEPEEEA